MNYDYSVPRYVYYRDTWATWADAVEGMRRADASRRAEPGAFPESARGYTEAELLREMERLLTGR